jgi:hypothetical protein
VGSDQPRFLDQPFLLKGTIEVSNYYNFGYRDVEQSHYSFDIIDSTQRHCYAYMERANADNLRQQLLAAGRPLNETQNKTRIRIREGATRLLACETASNGSRSRGE